MFVTVCSRFEVLSLVLTLLVSAGIQAASVEIQTIYAADPFQPKYLISRADVDQVLSK